MEEILASIRKIISEDSNDAPQPQAAAAVTADADVLELTHEVEEVAVAPAPQLAPAPVQPAPEPVADEVVFQTVDEAPSRPAPGAAPAPSFATEGLVSEKARSAVDDALSRIDFEPEDPHTAPVAPIDGHSVESVFDRAIRETFDPVLRAWLQEQADVIVERMKPAIREWMEENLPAMLKSAVEAEVARAVRTRTRR